MEGNKGSKPPAHDARGYAVPWGQAMAASQTPILLLDIMGTVVHDPFFVEVPRFFGMELRDILRAKHPTAWVRFERDEIDETTMLSEFFSDGRSFDGAGLKRAMGEAYRFLDGMEPLLQELHGAGVPMHALSNYPRWYGMIEDRLRLSRFMSWKFVSCHTGVRKPDAEAYLGPVRDLGVEPGRCLFVDDRQGNVDGAHAVGMPALRFEDVATLREGLAQHGVL